MTAGQVLHQILERQTGIEHVLDDQHVAAVDVDVQVLDDAHDARGLDAVAVARNGHEVDSALGVDGAHQIAHKDDGATQDGDEHEVLALVILGDLRTQALDDLRDVFLGEQDFLNIWMERFHGFPFVVQVRSMCRIPVCGSPHVSNGTKR